MIKTCPICHSQFFTDRNTKIYCSFKCRKKKELRQMKEERAVEHGGAFLATPDALDAWATLHLSTFVPPTRFTEPMTAWTPPIGITFEKDEQGWVMTRKVRSFAEIATQQ